MYICISWFCVNPERFFKVLGSFKTAYFDYKAKAVAECPSNPWRVQNNAVFATMDSFLERCHDVLDLTQTIAQFQKVRLYVPRNMVLPLVAMQFEYEKLDNLIS